MPGPIDLCSAVRGVARLFGGDQCFHDVVLGPNAVSGHAATAPPMRVMNSRRLMVFLPLAENCNILRNWMAAS